MPLISGDSNWWRFLDVFLTGNITDNAVRIIKWLIFAVLAYTAIGSLLVYFMQYNGEQVVIAPLSFRFNKTSCESDGILKGTKDTKDEIYKEYGWIPNTRFFWNTKEVRLQNKYLLEMLCKEADVVSTLDPFNIVKCAHSWMDDEGTRVNMIAEFFPSGYRNPEGYAAIKYMCRKIQNGIMHISSLLNVHCYSKDGDTSSGRQAVWC